MHLSVVQRGESVANSARHDQCYSSDVVKRHENLETARFPPWWWPTRTRARFPRPVQFTSLSRANAGFDHRL